MAAQTYRGILASLIATLPKPRTIVEVGVHRGRTSELLLIEFTDLHMHLVDPWAPYAEATAEQQASHKADAMRRIQRFRNRVTVHELPSVEAAASPDIPACPLVFIDADHSEAAAYADCVAWWDKVLPGGFLTGHDFGKPELGVERAVRRFATERGQSVDALPCNIWVIEKPTF